MGALGSGHFQFLRAERLVNGTGFRHCVRLADDVAQHEKLLRNGCARGEVQLLYQGDLPLAVSGFQIDQRRLCLHRLQHLGQFTTVRLQGFRETDAGTVVENQVCDLVAACGPGADHQDHAVAGSVDEACHAAFQLAARVAENDLAGRLIVAENDTPRLQTMQGLLDGFLQRLGWRIR